MLHEVVQIFLRLGFNFANLPLLGSCTLLALKHLMVVSSMWPIGPLVDIKVFNTNLIRFGLIFKHINMNGIMMKSFFEIS